MKSLTGIFLLFFFKLNLWSQPELDGIFMEEKPLIAESELVYRFFNNGTFVYQYWDDVGDNFGMGFFEVEEKHLILRYQTVPNLVRKARLISEDNNDTCSTLRVINPLIKAPLLVVDFQIFEDDSLIRQGKADAAGLIHFNLEENQSMKIYAYSKSQFQSFNPLILYEIYPSHASKDYVLCAHGLHPYTNFLGAKTETYRIRITQNGEAFKLKLNNEWVWYYKYEREK